MIATLGYYRSRCCAGPVFELAPAVAILIALIRSNVRRTARSPRIFPQLKLAVYTSETG